MAENSLDTSIPAVKAEASAAAPDPVNPVHYADLGVYSAVHVIARWGAGFCVGNALKYIQRAGKKAGESEVTDLKKAVWYLRRRIHELDAREPDPAAAKGGVE